MKAVVVYESLWGNTAAVARAIAEGIGPDARALSTAEARGAAIEGADLVVAGSPLLGFSLPTEAMRDGIRTQPAGPKADLSAPSMRSWLEGLPAGAGRSASFETRIWWSPGSAAKTIAQMLAAKGYASAAKPARFVVTGKYGPLKDGELDRARAWGAELAATTR